MKLTAPGALHLVHLRCTPAGIDAIGSALVGVPGVLMGRNNYISWGVTPGLIDQMDFYALDETVPGKTYKHSGIVYPVRSTDVEIAVNGQSNPTIVTLKDSEFYGPIVNDLWNIPGGMLAMRWTALNNDTSLDAYLSVMDSTDYPSFVSNAQKSVHANSYTFADTNNNIAYLATGRVPVRKTGHSGRFVVIGDGSVDSNTFVPVDQLPKSTNPTRGYFSSTDNRITPRGYPYTLSMDSTNGIMRAARIKSLMSNFTQNPVSVESAKKIQKDVHSALYDTFKPFLIQMAGNVSDDYEPWRKKVAEGEWNGQEELYSQETSVFEQWYAEMGELTKGEINRRWNNAPYLYNLLSNEKSLCDNQSCIAYAGKAFDASIKKLEDTYGSVPLWGSDVHEVDFNHDLLGNTLIKCLAGKTVVGVGGTQTLNYAPTEYPNLQTNYGVAYRQVVDMTTARDGNNDAFIVPLGQSGNFLAPGYDDLLNTWKDGNYVEMKRDSFDQEGGSLELKSE